MLLAFATPFDPASWSALGPQAILSLLGLLLIGADALFLKRLPGPSRRRSIGLIGGLGALGVLAWLLLPTVLDPVGSIDADPDPLVFGGALARDASTGIVQGMIAIWLALCIGLAVAGDVTEEWGTYLALLCWSAVALTTLAATEEATLLVVAAAVGVACLILTSASERTSESANRRLLTPSACALVGLTLTTAGLWLLGTTQAPLPTRLLSDVRESILRQAVERDPALGSGGQAIAGGLLVLAGLSLALLSPWARNRAHHDRGPSRVIGSWVASAGLLVLGIVALKIGAGIVGPLASRLGPPTVNRWLTFSSILIVLPGVYGVMKALSGSSLGARVGGVALAQAIPIGSVLLFASITDGDLAYDRVGSVIFALIATGFTLLGAFAVVQWSSDTGPGRGLDSNARASLGARPLGIASGLVLLSLASFPPLVGFALRLDSLTTAWTPKGAYGQLPAIYGLIAINVATWIALLIAAARILRVLPGSASRLPDTSVTSIDPSPTNRLPRPITWAIGLGALVALSGWFLRGAFHDPLRNVGLSLLTMNRPVDNRYNTELDASYDPASDPDNPVNTNTLEGLVIGGGPSGMGGGGGPPGGAAPRRFSPNPFTRKRAQDAPKDEEPNESTPP